jgi:two-component system, LytTR family, sensor kinase
MVRSSFKQLHLIVAFLLALYVLGSYKFYKTWVPAQGFSFTEGEYLSYTTISMLVMLLPSLFNYWYLLNRFEKRGYGILFFLIQGAFLSLTLWLHAGLDALYLSRFNVPWLFTEEHVYSRFFVVLCFMLMLGFSKLIQNNVKKQQEQSRLQVAQLEANMKFLRSQISPHFLFNTLNNIYSYAVQQKKETPELILKLSGILRYLSDAQNLQSLVPVEKELEAVNQLVGLYMVNTRWQPKVSWNVVRERNSGEPLLIEPQSLLTLAENAFKHCPLDMEGAYLKADIRIGDEGLVVTMENTINESKPAKAGAGTGLENLLQRLQITYGGKHRFNASLHNGVFVAHLFLPSVS